MCFVKLSHNGLSLSHCSCWDASQVVSGGLGQEGTASLQIVRKQEFPPNWSSGWEGSVAPLEVFRLSVIE